MVGLNAPKERAQNHPESMPEERGANKGLWVARNATGTDSQRKSRSAARRETFVGLGSQARVSACLLLFSLRAVPLFDACCTRAELYSAARCAFLFDSRDTTRPPLQVRAPAANVTPGNKWMRKWAYPRGSIGYKFTTELIYKIK
jgi:hypothetical protein